MTAGVAALLFSLPGNLFGGVAPVEGSVRVEPNVVAVIDGETLILNQDVVRLRGVAAPPRGASCRGSDGVAFDCGAASARALAGLVRDRVLTCQLAGRDGRGFAQADCRAADVDVNEALLAAGWARVQDGAEAVPAVFDDVERQARAAHRGIWAGVPGF